MTELEKTHTHFQLVNGNRYFFSDCRLTTKHLPAKYYFLWHDAQERLFFEPRKIYTDTIVELPNNSVRRAREIAQSFMKGEYRDRLRDLGMLHKLTVLLWGDEGTSKTVTIHQIIKEALANDWPVLDGTHSIHHLPRALRQYRMVSPDRGLVVVLEDIDRLLEDWEEKVILPILDGPDQQPDILFLLTTNHIKEIPNRLFRRGRRISLQVEFTDPTAEDRRAFFEQKIPGNCREGVDIDKWVEMTEGCSVDQCATALPSILAFRMTPEEYRQDVEKRRDPKNANQRKIDQVTEDG